MPEEQSNDEDIERHVSNVRMPARRLASPWTRRLGVVAIVAVVVLTPLWIDPATLATLRGTSSSTPAAAASHEADDVAAAATDAATFVWAESGSDTFERTDRTGWGTADHGGSWNADAPGSFSVVDGSGVAIPVGSTLISATLAPQTPHNTSVTFDLTVPAQADGLLVGPVLRRTGLANGYIAGLRFGPSGGLATEIDRFDATGLHVLVPPAVVADVSATPGSVLHVRADVTGIDPATISVRVWPATSREPHVWQQNVIDWTGALQREGAAGIGYALDGAAPSSGPVRVTIDNFSMSSADMGGHQ